MEMIEEPHLSSTLKFSSAVQISRPRSATKQGTSSLTNSPVNQIKVAKLVLKPPPLSISNKPSSPQKRETSTGTLARSLTTLDSLRLNQSNNFKHDDFRHEPSMKKYQQTVELEKKTRKVEKEKKTLIVQHQAAAAEGPTNKSTAMDEAARNEAREYMKKQREKRKLETKKSKEVDKSVVIRQRLDELRKTTKTVIVKKPKKNKTQIKISPPREFYSVNNLHMKEIKFLKLNPKSVESKNTFASDSVASLDDTGLRIEKMLNFETSATRDSLNALDSPIKIANVSTSPVKSKSPVRKPVSPMKKAISPIKKPAIPLQLQNHQNLLKPDFVQKSRPSSSKENRKPESSLKLTVPDVKLSFSILNKTEIVPQAHETFSKPQPKVPFWLQNSAVQPYPYNFIWAVRKKLEAYTSAEEAKRILLERTQGLQNLETPHLQLKKVGRNKKARKFPDFSAKQAGDDTKPELQRPTITDDSETNVTSVEQDPISEANTISGISSIKSDVAQVKSKSQDKDQKQDDDDTTISEYIFHSVRDDVFIGKKRESVNSDYSRASFEKENVDLLPENVSPNTTEKRVNFLSSTVLPRLGMKSQIEKQNDLDSNKLNQEKEGEYQKMLTAFNQSLSHVIEVNQMLSTVLSSKSSAASTQTSETVKNYSSSFENNLESETRKTSADSNISEMIENLVQQSQQPPRPVEPQSGSNSSIQTFIEDSASTTLKPDVDDVIEDPPIIYNEPAQEFSSSSTKVTTTTTTKIVQQKISIGKKEEHENTLNESKLLNMFESDTSFNIVDNNTSFGMLMDKSSSEIKLWERTLTERTRGQIAWLELQKQNFRKHGQLEKVSTIKKQQRAILLRLEKERSKLRESSERSVVKVQEVSLSSIAVFGKTINLTANDSEARENIERILQQREQKLVKRRAQVEHLIKWQRKLDKEEEKLKQIESDLLGDNMKKLSSSPRKKKVDDDLLNTSIVMVKSIDKSLKILNNIEPENEGETVEVSGAKLNKLWFRLTGINERLYDPMEIYHLNKQNFAQFYEEAKEVVLQSDLMLLLETSAVPRALEQEENTSEEKKIVEKTDESDVSTMNSIANIETEEEYPGSLPLEPDTETISTAENDEELHQLMANQMKVFLDHKTPTINEASPKDVSAKLTTPTIDNATFQVGMKTPDELDKSTSTVGGLDMDFEQDSLIQTEPLLSIDVSSVDPNGFIIPELNEIQITDMDQDEDNSNMLEDISFPNFDLSISDETIQQVDDEVRNDLSTITECTEYEQSQGSSEEEISSEIVSRASTATSERVNSEIEKRLISINDSMEEINEAFNKIAIVNRSPSSVTYSTDKDFVDSSKALTEESNEKSNSQNLLIFSPNDSYPMKGSGSQLTTSTPKILLPELLSEASGSSKQDKSEDF